MFNSNVQPKRRMKEKPTAWQGECRTPPGRYRLNLAHLTRCPERHGEVRDRAETQAR
jgi:hypothetical protein